MVVDRETRRRFADELRGLGASTGLSGADRVLDAFATVPREAFVGLGPWTALTPLHDRGPDVAARHRLGRRGAIGLFERSGEGFAIQTWGSCGFYPCQAARESVTERQIGTAFTDRSRLDGWGWSGGWSAEGFAYDL